MEPRLRARIGFAILALAVPTQFLVKAVADEPYPGLFMPPFNNVTAVHGMFSRTSFEVTVRFADGGHARIDTELLLAANDATPTSVYASVFDTNLDPTDPRTVAWFRGRLAVLFPRRDAKTVVIDVIRSTYRLADRSLISRHRVRSHQIEVG
ncbi:MAG: hypothetical protein JWQ70_57 [Aeromicrobium sp.]|nr:hypothetical protein [Aeromicrobium sp.]